MAIEINFDDIKGLAPLPGSTGIKPAAGLGIGTGGDLMQSISGVLDRINTTIANAKEMISLVRTSNPGQPGQQAGAVTKAYQPQPTLAQQLHRVVNTAYSVYGDITLAELLQTLLQQYGNTKLSATLKDLQRF